MISSILDFMRVEENERIACATYMIREDSRIWWEVVSQTRAVTTMELEEFKTLFNEKYYNDTVKAAKAEKFSRLLQGNRSVTDYALKFDRLVKFVPDLVRTDAARHDRFIQGLNAMIAREVKITSVPGETTYAQAVEKALTAEEVENKIWRENAARREVHRAVPPYSGSGRGGGPSDLKRKTPDASTTPGLDRRGRGT